MTQTMTREENQDTFLASDSGRVRRRVNWKWTEWPSYGSSSVSHFQTMGFINGRLASLYGQKAAERKLRGWWWRRVVCVVLEMELEKPVCVWCRYIRLRECILLLISSEMKS